MIREDAIDLLDNLIGMVDDNHGSDYDGALKMAIKALEQGLILDKIRAEIVDISPKTYPFVDHMDDYVKTKDVLRIIDKYKAESEG